VFPIEAMLESFERLIYAPALVVKDAKATDWEMRHIKQIGHQDTCLTVGRDMANQAHRLWLA